MGVTTHAVDLGATLVVVRRVPAEICARCGMEWIADETACELEQVVEEARTRCVEVEIVEYPACAGGVRYG